MREETQKLSPFRTSPDLDRSGGRDMDEWERSGPARASLVRASFWTSFVTLPLAAAGLAYATAPSRRSGRSRPAIAAVGVAFGLGLVRWQLDGRFSEEPLYRTEKRTRGLEIRRYAPVVVAETTLAGADWDEALNSGFRRLAAYISGKNDARAHIQLTPPVHTVQPGTTSGEKIAMTTPVAMTEHAGGHTVSFVMPEGRTLASLPVPLDSRVQLRELPARRVAVLRFSGAYTWEPVRAKMRQLLAIVERAGWQGTGDVHFGGYDPPWTLPFLRRNEVWIELAHGEAWAFGGDRP
jgi:DNA gyrase inhibitor GyrI